MANFDNSDRVLNGLVTELFGTTGDDTFSLLSTFNLSTGGGVLDGLGGADTLILNSANLSNVDIENIEATDIVGVGTTLINADQWSDLGQVSIKPTSSTSSFLVLSNPDGASVDMSNVTVDPAVLWFVRAPSLSSGDTISIDFSGTALGAGAALDYTGSSGDETVVGSSSADNISVSSGDASVTGGAGNDTIDGNSGVSTISGGAGDDTITFSTTSGTLQGDAGDDTITLTSGLTNGAGGDPVQVLGGTGQDMLTVVGAFADNAVLDGGADDDTLLVRDSIFDNNAIDGGSGTDALQLRNANLSGTTIQGIESTEFLTSSTIRIDVAQLPNLGAVTMNNVFAGTASSDANLSLDFNGAATPQTVVWTGLSSLGAEQRLHVSTTQQSPGDEFTLDVSATGMAADAIFSYLGGSGNETIVGTAGQDILNAASGTADLTGGAGDDLLTATSGFATLLGGSGDDTITGSSVAGLIDGGTGNDTLTQNVAFFFEGARQSVTVLGGTGMDAISVTSLQGTGSVVDAGADDDTLDLSFANLLDGTLDGGSGSDTVTLNGGSFKGTTFQNIEETEIDGSSLVTLDALQLANLGDLNIVNVFANTANDANLRLNFTDLTSPPDIDVAFGGLAGLDFNERLAISVVGQTAAQDVTVDFSTLTRADDTLLTYSGGNANETITGTAGDDVLRASSGTNAVTGDTGNDTLSASSGLSTLEGGLGDDVITTSNTSGVLDGGDGDDTINQSTGFFDSTLGQRVAITILGGAGEDQLSVSSAQGDGSSVDGGADDDTLNLTSVTFLNGTVAGGAGTDKLSLSSANMAGTVIQGIESTTLSGSGLSTVDADHLINLGTLEVLDIFGNTANDANLRLNYAGFSSGQSVASSFGNLTGLDTGERLAVSQVGQTTGVDASIDFSGIARAADTSLTFTGSTADETVTGTSGDDKISVSSGTNFVSGGQGDDSLTAGNGYSTLEGGQGNDTLSGSSTSGLMDGGAGDDVINVAVSFFDGTLGQRVPITILGGTGQDTVTTTSVLSTGTSLDTGADDDLIEMSSTTLTDSSVNGGTGTDALVLRSSNLTGTEFSGLESTQIETNGTINIDASQVSNLGALTINDQFTGQNTTRDANINLRNNLDATADFSQLSLGANERIYVTRSSDGAGLSVIDFSGATGTASSVIEYIGVGSADREDYVIGSALTDLLNGGAGTAGDTISYEGSDAAVTINLDTQSVSGGHADGDTITNFANAAGSSFDDTLIGSATANVLTGFGGDDSYTSGAGDDSVLITAQNGDDIWSDFTTGGGANRVVLRGLPKDAAILSVLTATEVSGNTVLSFNTGGSITLQGEALASFDLADVHIDDGVYAIDEAFTVTEDAVLTGDILAANAPDPFADLEIIGGAFAAAGGLAVQDFTIEGQTLMAGSTATLASGATLTVQASGSFVYDPTTGAGTQALSELLGQALDQSFSYTAISTITAEVDEGDVTLTVTALNDAPVISGTVTASGVEDGAHVNVDLLANASDVDDQDVLSVINVSALPAGALRNGNTLTLDPGAAAYQVLAGGEVTTLAIDYDVQDLFGAVTPGGRTEITLTGVNDTPTLAAGTLDAVEDGAAVTLDLSALGDDIDSDDTGATLGYSVVGQPAEGSAQINGTILTFNPNADFQTLSAGEERDVTITVEADDGNGGVVTNTVIVTVTGENDAPVATDDADTANTDFRVTESGAFTTSSVLVNDTDIDALDTLSVFSFDASGILGLLTLNPDGTFNYDTNGQFEALGRFASATETFTYVVTDGQGGFDTGRVDITVTGQNDLPIAVADSISTDENTALATFSVIANDTDVDLGDPLNFLGVSASGVIGALTNNGDGTFSYDPNGQFESLNSGDTAVETFTYTIDDSTGGSVQPPQTGTVTLTVHGVNDAPDAANDQRETNEDTAVSGNLLANDSDVDNAAVDLSVTEIRDSTGTLIPFGTPYTLPEGGTLLVQADGSYTFDPGNAYQSLADNPAPQPTAAQVQIGYTVSDGAADDVGTLILNVRGLNDAPTLGAGTATLGEDTASTTLDLTSLGADIDNDDTPASLTYAITSGPASGSATLTGANLKFNTDGAFEDLDTGDTRDVTIGISATDSHGETVFSAVAVTINGANDAPVITNAALTATVNENDTDVLTITASDADAGDLLSFALAGGADVAQFQIDQTTGTLSFIAAPDFETPLDQGADNVYDVNVAVSDGNDTDIAAVQVTVNDLSFEPKGVIIEGTSGDDVVAAGTTVGGQPLPTVLSDWIIGFGGDDDLSGLSGDDLIEGNGGADILRGNAGDDRLDGGLGNDVLDGGVDNDTLEGGAGDDSLDGGAGAFDFAAFESSATRVVASLNTGSATGDGTDSLLNIEGLIGSRFNDRLTGDANANVLYGRDGNDVLIGLGDSDTLYGEDGDDTLIGSGGNDMLYGGNGDDVLNGVGGADLLDGGAGNDELTGDVGVDQIFGGEGRDDIFGNFGADTIDGGGGNDNIRAGGSGDIVNGGAGNDRLIGANGKDTIWGGAGNDTLLGGGGAGTGDGLRDVFVFKSAANGGGGFDIIRDFEDTTDKLDLSESGYTDFADVFADATQVGANVEINFDFGGLLRINDFVLADFTAGDVLF